MAKNSKQPELEFEDVERITFEAMRHHGLIPPMTLDEVADVEAELDGIELPFTASDPAKLLNQWIQDDVENPSTHPLNASQSLTERNLAFAAREGGELLPEIKSRMVSDKARHIQQKADANS